MKQAVTTIKDGVANCIKTIGQNLIDKAEDIARDTDGVTEITIYAKLTPHTVVAFDVEKTYIARLPNENNKEV